MCIRDRRQRRAVQRRDALDGQFDDAEGEGEKAQLGQHRAAAGGIARDAVAAAQKQRIGEILVTVAAKPERRPDRRLSLIHILLLGGFIGVVLWFDRVDFYNKHFFDTGTIVFADNAVRIVFVGIFSWLIYAPGACLLYTSRCV